MVDVKLPLGEDISDADIRRYYNMVQDIPFKDKSLSYKVLVPKDWKPITIESSWPPIINAEKMTGIGMFVSSQKNKTPPFILLQVMELSQEIVAADVLRSYVLANNYRLKALQEESPKRVDSLVEFEMEGAQFLGRAMMAISGNRLGFLLAASSPVDYAILVNIFALAVASFDMPNAPEGDIELWQEFKIGSNWLSFRYPSTWSVNRPPSINPSTRTGVELYNTDANEDVIGIIRIKVVLKTINTSAELELKKYMDELEEMGLEFGEIIDQHDLSVSGRFIDGHQVIYQVLDKEVGLVREAWCTLLVDSDYWTFISLLTTRREDYFSIWAVNKRAWQIVMNTLQ